MNDKKLKFVEIGNKMKILATFTLKLKGGAKWSIEKDGIQDDMLKKGITGQGIKDWIAGKTKSAYLSKIKEIVDVLNDHLRLKEPLTVEDFSDETDGATFLKRLRAVGFSKDDTYKADAEAWAKDHVIGTHFSLYKGAIEAEDDYSGLYKIRRRPMGNGKTFDTKPIRLVISYAIPLNQRGAPRHFLFCELAVPGKDKKLYRYRGYFSTDFSVHTWVFFQETERSPDMLVFMTKKDNFKTKREKRGGKVWSLAGKMLTATASPYVPVSYDLELIWDGDFNDPDDIEKFLSVSK